MEYEPALQPAVKGHALRRVFGLISGYLLISAAAALFVLLEITPHWPKTILGWTLVFFGSLPLLFLMEGLGSMLFPEFIGRRLGPADSLSVARILYGVLVGFCLLVYFVVSEPNGGISDFIAQHFR